MCVFKIGLAPHVPQQFVPMHVSMEQHVHGLTYAHVQLDGEINILPKIKLIKLDIFIGMEVLVQYLSVLHHVLIVELATAPNVCTW